MPIEKQSVIDAINAMIKTKIELDKALPVEFVLLITAAGALESARDAIRTVLEIEGSECPWCHFDEEDDDEHAADCEGVTAHDAATTALASPLLNVLIVLADAAELLLLHYNHDGEGHENIALCRDRAREMVQRLSRESQPTAIAELIAERDHAIRALGDNRRVREIERDRYLEELGKARSRQTEAEGHLAELVKRVKSIRESPGDDTQAELNAVDDLLDEIENLATGAGS